MRINNLVAIAVTSLILTAPAVLAQFSKSTISSQINSQFPDQNTGQITPSTTRAFLNNMLNSYQQYAGVNVQAGATYTIQPSDYGHLVQFDGGNVAVTLSPANSSGYTTFNFYAQNITPGNVVITPTGGSTICGASSLTLQNTEVTWVISDATNYQCLHFSGQQLTTPLTVANGGTGGSTASGTLLDNITGFSSTGFLLRRSAGSYNFLAQAGGLTLGNITQANANTTICNPSNSNQNLLNCTPGQMSLVLCPPTRQNILAAITSSNYTTPTCNGALPTTLEITMVGGGGGGGGSGTAPQATQGQPGGQSCFNTSSPACTAPYLSAGGGGGGVTQGATAASPGGAASALCDIGISGGSGMGSTGAGAVKLPGAYGAASFYGGAGAGSSPEGAINGNAAAASSGSGGGGGGGSAASIINSGAGGAAGAYCFKMLTPTNILTSYNVTVGGAGAAGIAGTNGATGGAGASGQISIKALWQ